MSNLKYKSSNSTNTTNTSTQQPIWCSLSTPSQIARKYASIAPIWCHISRPRQLKKKFASTFHQAQNLLTRQHSKDANLSSSTRNLANNTTNTNANADDSDEMSQKNGHDTEYKSAWSTNGIGGSGNGGGGGGGSANTDAKLKGSQYDYDNDSFNDAHRSSLRKRDSSLDIKRKTEKLLAAEPTSSNSYLLNSNRYTLSPLLKQSLLLSFF